MKVTSYKHNWIDDCPEHPLLDGVVDAIESAKFIPRRKSAAQMKGEVLKHLQMLGWAGEVEIDSTSGITITSIKGRTGLCFQTGNMARMYADLLKLQAVFAKRVIDDGTMIIPTKSCAKILGSNIANFERLTHELKIFKAVVTMPLLVIGVS